MTVAYASADPAKLHLDQSTTRVAGTNADGRSRAPAAISLEHREMREDIMATSVVDRFDSGNAMNEPRICPGGTIAPERHDCWMLARFRSPAPASSRASAGGSFRRGASGCWRA